LLFRRIEAYFSCVEHSLDISWSCLIVKPAIHPRPEGRGFTAETIRHSVL
jgi:hypothetical protein